VPRPLIKTITASRFNIKRILADVDDGSSLRFMMTLPPCKRHNPLIEEHCAFSKTDNYASLFAAALPFALLAAQARSSAFFQAAVIFLFCLGF
jgi:hypothetical protein